MDTREMIERALGSFVSRGWREEMALKGWEFYKDDFLNALAKQAIVIECRLEHLHTHYDRQPYTELTVPPDFWFDMPRQMRYEGHHGTQGKAIAIIVSLENNADTEQS